MITLKLSVQALDKYSCFRLSYRRTLVIQSTPKKIFSSGKSCGIKDWLSFFISIADLSGDSPWRKVGRGISFQGVVNHTSLTFGFGG